MTTNRSFRAGFGRGGVLAAVLAAGAFALAWPVPAQAAPVSQAAEYSLDATNDTLYTPGETGTIHGNGFAPGSEANLTLEPEEQVQGFIQTAGGVAIATLPVDANGVVDGSFVIPENTAVGKYSLVLSGPAFSGAGTHTIRYAIEIVDQKPADHQATPALGVTGSESDRWLAIGLALVLLGGVALVGRRMTGRRTIAAAR
jgi:hypothetical protein